MQHNQPDDWVLATGETYKVKDFAKLAFSEVGLDSRIIRTKLLDLVDSNSMQVLEDILAKCGLGQYAKSTKEILASQASRSLMDGIVSKANHVGKREVL